MVSADLNEIYKSIWKKLETAVKSRHESWHLVTLATIRDDKPEIRTLVLRGADKEKNLIWMHTDLRSPKAQDILKNSEGALLFYDPIARWQLRLNGRISFDSHSETTEHVWKNTSASAKRCYQGAAKPSTLTPVQNSNLPKEPVSPHLGRENFTRVLFQVSKIDWLFLRAEGHLRAKWEWNESQLQGNWAIP